MTERAEHILDTLRHEEPTWRTIGFDDRQATIIDVGRTILDESASDAEYYRRQLFGEAALNHLDEKLDQQKREPIDPREALRLRRTYDAFWRYRTHFVEVLEFLSDHKFWEDQTADLDDKSEDIETEPAVLETEPEGLTGYWYRPEVSKDFCCEVSVSNEGKIDVRIDADPSYNFCLRKGQPVKWHKYLLTPGQPTAEREVKLMPWEGKLGQLEPRTIYAPTEVTLRSLRWLLTIAHDYGMPVDSGSLLI